MCRKESWGAIAIPKEAHFTQSGQPLRMHGPGLVCVVVSYSSCGLTLARRSMLYTNWRLSSCIGVA